MLVNREKQQKKTDKKSEAPERIGCIGTVELPDDVFYTTTGSGYIMIFLDLVAYETTDGIPATFNLMFHPDWLQDDFDPMEFEIELTAQLKATARVKRARKEGKDPLNSDLSLIAQAKKAFVYQTNIFDSKGASTLQNLLGGSFDEFIDELEAKKPEDFLQSLKAYSSSFKESLFLYECQQRRDKDSGELMQQMNVVNFSRVEKLEDIEEWAAKRKVKGTTITFDPTSFELGE